MIFKTFLLFFLCFFYIGFCQNDTTISPILKSNNALENKIKSVDSIASLYDFQNKHALLNSLYQEYSTWLYARKDYKNTIEVLNKAIENQHNLAVIDTLLWQHRLYYLGLSYRKNNQYKKSIEVFQHPIIRYRTNEKTAKSYSELGRNYKAIGDYYKAIDHYELGASLLSRQGNNKSLSTNYFNTAFAYKLLKTPKGYEQSRQYFLKADSLSNYVSIDRSLNCDIKLGLGNSYNQTKNLDIPKAFTYYMEALDIATEINDSFRIFMIYNELGNLFNTSYPDRGITYLKKAIPYTQNNALYSFYIKFNLGTCYLTKGHYDQSIATYLKAINYIIKINPENLESIYNTSSFYNVKNKISLLDAFRDLSNAYLKKYEVTKNEEILHKAIATYVISDQLLDVIRIESTELQSRLHWRKQSSEIYGSAIKACFLANNKEKAFYFMEKSKALLLAEELKNRQLKKQNEIPEHLIEKEIQLKKEIYILEKQRIHTQDSIAALLIREQNKLSNLQDSIKSSYTDFEAINTTTVITNIKDVQATLQEDEVIVTYHISSYQESERVSEHSDYKPMVEGSAYGMASKNNAYGMMITKNEVNFFELGNPKELKIDVVSLSKKMATPFQSDVDTDSYTKVAYKVFASLFPSDELRASIKNKKLLIIPDTYLHYISFEALATTDNAKKPSYLIKDTEVTYAYSNSFKKAVIAHEYDAKNSFLGFAPKEFEQQNLSALPTSDQEINVISAYFPGTQYVQKEATKETFLTELPNYEIIHLATHADAQDSISPWIAFRENKLTLEELYLNTNSAKMVVLSGCKTQVGKQEIGEGVMSLARGFFHSGAESVVSSLWDVQDTSTSYIMKEFYKNLSNKQTKSAALRNAKLHYLDTHMLTEISPSFWASFVIMGNTNPLSENQDFLWWWLFLLPGFFAVFLIYKKSIKNR